MITTGTNGGDVSAMNQMAFLRDVAEAPKGAIFKGRQRVERPGLTNADIIEFQAEKGRDIQPNQDDANDAGSVFQIKLNERLIQLSKPFKSGKRKGQIRGGKQTQINRIASRNALRAAMVFIQARMVERITSQMGSDGKPLDEVGKEYAKKRQEKYGVPTSAVLKATGQLLNNIENGSIQFVNKAKVLDIFASNLKALGF